LIHKKIMSTESTEKITVETIINKPVDLVWEYWTAPEHIQNWNNASDDWHTPHAKNDLRDGGDFIIRMESKDGTMGFDFGGTYDHVIIHETINYTMGDGRKVLVNFDGENNVTKITETFDPEKENPAEMQRAGWQAILDNFKKYCEK